VKLNIVPASKGFQWVQLGMRTFMKQPLALTALVFMYTSIALAMLLVPIVGALLMMAIVPVGTLGLMAATRAAENGTFPMPAVLFTGLRASRERLRAMLVLGGLYAAAVLAIDLLVRLLVEVPTDSKNMLEVVQSPQFRTSVMLTAALYIPVSLAFWHAPALVHWHGVPPLKSLFFSFVACLRNARAFLAYALAWGAVIVVIVAASAVAALVSPWLTGVVLGATTTIATIAFYISIYFTFRDSFLDAEPNPGDTQ
jgi:hypothetical protein